jgi:hypothetical protein
VLRMACRSKGKTFHARFFRAQAPKLMGEFSNVPDDFILTGFHFLIRQ